MKQKVKFSKLLFLNNVSYSLVFFKYTLCGLDENCTSTIINMVLFSSKDVI